MVTMLDAFRFACGEAGIYDDDKNFSRAVAYLTRIDGMTESELEKFHACPVNRGAFQAPFLRCVDLIEKRTVPRDPAFAKRPAFLAPWR